MTKKQLEELAHTFGSYKLAEKFYLSVCAFFYEMDINGQVFIDTFVEKYIKHVKSKTNRIGDIILNTGFTKTMIKNTIDGVSKTKQFTTKSFFSEMLIEIKKICERNNDLTIKIKGNYNSFNSIYYRNEASTKQLSSGAFLDVMIKRGILKKLDNNTVQLIQSYPANHVNTKEKCLNTFTVILERLTHTLIRNHKAKDDESKNFQQWLYSPHIDPSRIDEGRAILKKLARKHWLEYLEVLESLEVKTEFEKKRVEETGAELGISTFVYVWSMMQACQCEIKQIKVGR